MRLIVWTIINTIIAAAIVLAETRMLPKEQRRERAVVVAVTALGWLIVLMNLYFPDSPGPNELVKVIYTPLGTWLTDYAERFP